MTDLLWHVSLAECREQLLKEENYGYGLIKRRIKKFLPYSRSEFNRHRELYFWWMDMFVYKTLRNEGIHAPIYLVEPRFEQELMYDWWKAYQSYKWQGAKKI
jgi:hypothetical protein